MISIFVIFPKLKKQTTHEMLPCDIFLERWTFRQGWCIVFFSTKWGAKKNTRSQGRMSWLHSGQGNLPISCCLFKVMFFYFLSWEIIIETWGVSPTHWQWNYNHNLFIFLWRDPSKPSLSTVSGPGGSPKLNSIWGLKLLFQGATFLIFLQAQFSRDDLQSSKLGWYGLQLCPFGGKAKKGPLHLDVPGS